MEQAFSMAAQNNLTFFYQNPINLQIQDSRKQSLLHYAVRTSANEVIEYLLTNEIDVNVIDYMGETPLFDCVRKSKISIAKRLIRRFANVNIKNAKGELPIHIAASKADVEMMKLLVENGSNVDELTNRGESVLHYAIRSNQVEFLKYTLQLSSRFSSETDNQGNTLLHVASGYGLSNITEYLLESMHNPHLKNERLETPLFHAIKSGSIETISLLLNHGAYVNLKNRFGESISDIASQSDSIGVKELIETHLQGSLYQKNIKKYPLRYAVIKEDMDLLRTYLYQGTKDIKDEYQMNACEYASKKGLKEFIKQLKEKS
ncbi:MAG: ankyrin repeat domain-containing protein [Paracholeplasma sp.]|nr:ankyrin repeat domain-containing protein [Paracholeplasma sp.]MDY3195903.1 ankyrin repeat domain-containing protein [Paracholeplasma sp.]